VQNVPPAVLDPADGDASLDAVAVPDSSGDEDSMGGVVAGSSLGDWLIEPDAAVPPQRATATRKIARIAKRTGRSPLGADMAAE
jgi:hypothetical protein